MLTFPGHPADELLYLSREDVVACVDGTDVVAVVEDAVARHGNGQTMLPDEAYLGWSSPDGAAARSLAMPGGLYADDVPALGVKVINGCLGNPDRGLARAQGLLLLFDAETAWPEVVMEAAYVSALRTAALSAVATRHLATRQASRLAVLGCGTLARAHLLLLPDVLPCLAEVVLFDRVAERAVALAAELCDDPGTADLRVEVAADAEQCVAASDVVTTTTVTTQGYIPLAWLAPGALVLHVSLDDVLPDVVAGANLVVVDDWGLVSSDERRLLGRMYHAGQLVGPGPDGDTVQGTVRVHATLADVVTGAHPGRARDHDIILCNPFGMSILDVAVGHDVARVARTHDRGRRLPR